MKYNVRDNKGRFVKGVSGFKGYDAADDLLCCNSGCRYKLYEAGKTYAEFGHELGKPGIMHFCRRLIDVYEFKDLLRLDESHWWELYMTPITRVIATGDIYDAVLKSGTNKLSIRERMPFRDIFRQLQKELRGSDFEFIDDEVVGWGFTAGRKFVVQKVGTTHVISGVRNGLFSCAVCECSGDEGNYIAEHSSMHIRGDENKVISYSGTEIRLTGEENTVFLDSGRVVSKKGLTNRVRATSADVEWTLETELPHSTEKVTYRFGEKLDKENHLLKVGTTYKNIGDTIVLA